MVIGVSDEYFSYEGQISGTASIYVQENKERIMTDLAV